VLNKLSLILSPIGGFLAFYLGGYDVLLRGIIALVFIDYISGLICALYEKKLSSEIGWKGIIKKVMIFLVIATAVVVERMLQMETPIREITIVFYASNEGISILENASIFLPIPDKFKQLFLQLRE